MLVAAALVPDTALLVPGAGGLADPARRLREAALAVVAQAVAGAAAVVVVAPAHRTSVRGRARASLGAAGVPDALLGWPPPAVGHGPLADGLDGPDDVVGVPASVGLHLLAQVGWRGPTTVVEVAPDPAPELAARGAALVADRPTTLVVVGSGSGRHGPDAPLADDERAPVHDAALLAELARGDAGARARLAARPADDAAALAVTGWAPWQVLVGAAAGAEVTAHLEHAEVLAGAQHAVLAWAAS